MYNPELTPSASTGINVLWHQRDAACEFGPANRSGVRTLKNAERILAAYAEADSWEVDHDDAIRCFDMEELIAVGGLAFEFLSFVESAWQDHVSAGKIEYQEEDDRQIGRLYQKWVEITERNVAEVEKLTRNGFQVKGADQFFVDLEEARSLIESRTLEAEMLPIEEILPLAHGNPRPERYSK